MKARTWVVLILVGLAVGGGFIFSNLVAPVLRDMGLSFASDAARIKGTIAVGGDNYLGYWFLSSREFTNRLRHRGYLVNWTNDQGDYAERHRKLADGKYDAIVLPINSYLFHGLAHRYPGVIPAALSESRGADSIVGYADRLAGDGSRSPTVNDLNNPGLKICVTPDSPSEFLLHVAVAHFALDDLKKKGPWEISTRGSEDAYTKLQRKECEVAVLWEPDVSKALTVPNVAAVFGSDQVAEMIVDVFVARRQWVKDSPDAVDAFFQSYFETIAHYSSQRDQLLTEIARNPSLGSKEAAERAVSRIGWFGLEDNCRDWLNAGSGGVFALGPREKLVETISQVTSVMVQVGDLRADPLAGNPYAITNTDILGRLCGQQSAAAGIGGTSDRYTFPPLADEEWVRLRSIGRMRILPITFDASTPRLTREGSATVNQVGTALVQNYPQYRVLVKGHTAPAGEEAANLALSEERAQAVRNHLTTTFGIDAERLRALGVGSRELLARAPGEGELAYRSRLARVEFVLLEGSR